MLRSGGNFRHVSCAIAMQDDREKFPDKTVQSEKDNCDINVILRRFRVTGQMPPGSTRVPSYGDYDAAGDFQSAMNVIREAQEQFAALPSGVRARFGNDPQMFLEFCSKPENVDEMLKMGLATANMDPREVSRETVKESGDVGDSKKRVVKGSKAVDRSAEDSQGE